MAGSFFRRAVAPPPAAAPKEVELLNVSYDPTRELWRDLNEKFSASYEQEHGGAHQFVLAQLHRDQVADQVVARFNRPARGQFT